MCPYGHGRRICIWLDVDNGNDYFVILYVHRRYVRLLTAFYGDSPNYAKKRLKEYEDWKEKVGCDFTPDELVSDIISDHLQNPVSNKNDICNASLGNRTFA